MRLRIKAFRNGDVQRLILGIFRHLNFRCIAGNNKREHLRLSEMVHRLHGIDAAPLDRVRFPEAVAADERAVLAVHVEHRHLVKYVCNGDRDRILEIVRPVERNGIGISLARRIQDFGCRTDNDEVIFAGIAPIVQNGQHMPALRFDHGADERLSVHQAADVSAELHRIGKDRLSVRIGIQVLPVRNRRGSFLPIIIALYSDFRVFRDDLV